MKKDISNQKLDSKWSKWAAIVSLVLGIICISFNLGMIGIPYLIFPIAFVHYMLFHTNMMDDPIGGVIAYIITVSLIAFVGVILGLLGLKSTKRKFAICGIILSVIGLILPYFIFYR